MNKSEHVTRNFDVGTVGVGGDFRERVVVPYHSLRYLSLTVLMVKVDNNP